MTEPSKFTADDRGNVVDFYDADDGDEAGRLDREHAADGSSYYFEGSDALKAWAMENGYREGIEFAMETGNKPAA